MGLCLQCLTGTSSEDHRTPDQEARRRQQAEAAERRMHEQESRGIKNVEKVKEQQRKRDELERREREAILQGDKPLRWQVG